MYYNIYEALNLSIDFYKSYSYSETYRKEVTDKILSFFNKYEIESVCFFGVGNGCDVDYFKMINHGVVMTLTDIDLKAMERAIHFAGIEPEEVRVFAFDYLGNCEDLIKGLVKRMEKLDQEDAELATYHASLDFFYKGLLKKIEMTDYRVYLKESQDLLVLLPIYTQLLFVELVSKLSHIRRFNDIQNALFQHMIGVIDRFNYNLVNLISQRGVLFVLSDIVEIHEDDELFRAYAREISGLKEEREDLVQSDFISLEVQNRIEKYESQYGFGLGSYGLLNLEDYMVKSEETYYLWQFDDKRAFLVKGVVYHRQG